MKPIHSTWWTMWEYTSFHELTPDERFDIWGRDHHCMIRREGGYVALYAAGRKVLLPRESGWADRGAK